MRLINENAVIDIIERITNEAVEEKQLKHTIQQRIISEIAGLPTIDKDIKKPICFVYDHLGGAPYVCPSCGGTLYDSDWYESTKREYHHDRCVHCGQSIDWEAENISEYKGRTAYSRPDAGGDN